MTQLTCPTCRRLFDSRQADAMPFCSERCRLIDLHRWLAERHGVPIEREGGDDPQREGDPPTDGGAQ